jgi:hypothetical protein
MKQFPILTRLFFAAALFFAAFPCQADDASQASGQQGNRFLFIVDTSAAMRSYSNAVVQGIVELMESNMRDEFRPGDTIGLWTYNDKLHPEFPMQVWTKADKDNIVADIAAFLQDHRYGRRAHLEKVMPEMNRLIKNSERITIVLISDGSGLIQGTPFDKEINTLQRKYVRELRSVHMPFVTVLAAHYGAVFDYTINYPGVVAIPHTANPEIPVETNAPVVAVVPTPVTNAPEMPPPVHSIIMTRANLVQAAPPPPIVAAPVVVQPPPPVLPVAVAPAPPAREIAPAQASPPPPPVAPQNPAPVSSAPQPNPPPASTTANDQPPQSAPPSVQNAPIANIGPSGVTQVALYVIAFSLLTIAAVLVVFLVRRSRRVPQPSLISQSIDRPH